MCRRQEVQSTCFSSSIHCIHLVMHAVLCLIPCMHREGDLQTCKIAPNVGVENDRKN